MSPRNLIRSAVQLPFFSIDGVGAADLFEHTAAVAQSADTAGFDALFVMDHFHQLPFLGGASAPMLEGYSLLAALAARTTRIRLGAMVTGVTYRNPALLAKTITTLDVISRGRAIAGLGAAWYEEEHTAFGYDFPSTADRFELLDETIAILRDMFADNAPNRVGAHSRVAGPRNVPGPITAGGPPILVGGSGERRTLPLVARSAQASNLNCELGEVPRKLERLTSLLADEGRSRDDLNVTVLCSVVVADDEAAAEQKLRTMVAGRGMDPARLDDPGVRSMMLARLMVGSVDRVGEQMAAMCGPDGLDGIVAMLPADVANPEGPALVAKAFRAAGLMD